MVAAVRARSRIGISLAALRQDPAQRAGDKRDNGACRRAHKGACGNGATPDHSTNTADSRANGGALKRRIAVALRTRRSGQDNDSDKRASDNVSDWPFIGGHGALSSTLRSAGKRRIAAKERADRAHLGNCGVPRRSIIS
jgi:hypothetical protein